MQPVETSEGTIHSTGTATSRNEKLADGAMADHLADEVECFRVLECNPSR